MLGVPTDEGNLPRETLGVPEMTEIYPEKKQIYILGVPEIKEIYQEMIITRSSSMLADRPDQRGNRSVLENSWIYI